MKLLKVISADVASSYIQNLSDELVYKIAGQEFGSRKENVYHCKGNLWIEVIWGYLSQ